MIAHFEGRRVECNVGLMKPEILEIEMPKVRLLVKETLQHEVEVDVDAATLKLLQKGGLRADEIAGDFCSRTTMQDGEWELEDVEVLKPNAGNQRSRSDPMD